MINDKELSKKGLIIKRHYEEIKAKRTIKLNRMTNVLSHVSKTIMVVVFGFLLASIFVLALLSVINFARTADDSTLTGLAFLCISIVFIYGCIFHDLANYYLGDEGK